MTLKAIPSAEPQTLVARSFVDESWKLLLLQTNAHVRIYCISQGVQTLASFGVPWHASCVGIALPHLDELSHILAGPLGDTKRPIAELLQNLFANEEFDFADLLDLLDGAGIPYSYQCYNEHEATFRPA